MKKLKEVLLCALSVFVVLLSTACNKTGGEGAAASASGGQSEPTVVTVSTNRATMKDFDGNSFWETEVWQDFQKKVNVKVDFYYYDIDKMGLQMASGDLTDIVVTNQRFLPNVFSANMAMKLDPILETHIPNALLPMYKTRNEMLRLFMGGSDNGIYILSPGLGPENVGGQDASGRGYSVRWDYYKEVGAPPVDNDDQFVAAIKAMAEKHPTTPDGRKIWGMGINNDLTQFYVHGMLTAQLNQWTILLSQYMGHFVTNEIHNGYTDTNQSAYWNDMELYNKLHREGLFDPDSFTQTLDELTAKQNEGIYLASTVRNDGLYTAMRQKDPNTLAGFMLVPSAGTAVFANKPLVMGNAPDDSMFISAKSNNWEAAARLINIMQDPDVIRSVYSGFKGIHWDYDANGVPTIFDKTIESIASRTPEIVKAGLADTLHRQFIFGDYTARHPDGHFFDLKREPAFRSKRTGLSPLYIDYADFYGVDYPSLATLKNVENGTTIDMSRDFVQLISVGMTDIPRDVERIIQNLNDILYRALPRLITAESDAAFAAVQKQVLDELNAAGEPAAWEWVSTNYNKYKALTDPIIQEYLSSR